ncbi:putative mitochondrial chaperone [Lachnellula occidentalis]|uniref:Putative mitochondrial chaperone n=1 Tax=Lachnellula occidentalis TaxID=215460 RepID=A0A8H8U7B2_9HELO|nr:putative mitochondrial chaperone [Lachnellula occidentalis]
MNQSCNTGDSRSNTAYPNQLNPQTALLDAFFPGFSLLSSALSRYSSVDLTLYFPTLLAFGLLIFGGRYLNEWLWGFLNQHAMSTADIRTDDEMYNMFMGWVANQQFAQRSRRFVANTDLNSRTWFLFRDWDDEDKEDEVTIDFDDSGNPISHVGTGKQQKKVRFTPSFGTHYFWYKRHLLLFSRTQDTRQGGFASISEREEISVSCFGRNPAILKELLDDCRTEFLAHDENRTIIYRGGTKSGTAEVNWVRCISRVSRPFSTIVLDESVKQSLLDDMKDYLHPYTRRWYSNRGIPYRRGYLLYGPPGTGKSSLSFAIAGHFKLKIYIVSLNSAAMNEENLSQLFSELPKQCVVLLEDIDTAGLTHTRDNKSTSDEEVSKPLITAVPGTTVVNPTTVVTPTTPPPSTNGRISLSALLNILDGVASQEGRVLIMTTNHIEKLDEALIRPGRVDMTIKFDLASREMITTIFRAIFATLEGDIPTPKSAGAIIRTPSKTFALEEKLRLKKEREEEEEMAEMLKRKEEKVNKLAVEFAGIVPAMAFSPAEIQGYLLKNKRDPEAAVKGAAEWVVTMESDKRKKKAKEEREEKARVEKEKEDADKAAKEEGEEKARVEKEKQDSEKAAKEAPGEAKKVEPADAEKECLCKSKPLVNGIEKPEETVSS